MEWQVLVNHNRVDNIWADTYMEAELIARIAHGTAPKIDIKAIPEPEVEESSDWGY